MQEMSVFWLRAAAALYAIGLFHTIQVAIRKGRSFFRGAMITFCAGVILHLVATVEASKAAGQFPPPGLYNSVSLCALLVAILFLLFYRKYRFESLGVFLFPVIFVMTAVASAKSTIGVWSDQEARNISLVVHILLVLLGYASLILTALASVLYLVQERQLKTKKPIALLERLPPLGTLDSIISRSMGFGFVLMTVGVVTGAAFIEPGTAWMDPRISSALVTWAFFLVMVFLRITAGWRGRKAALMAVTVVACSAATWAVHYMNL
jgi:ABC-type uncharacterized transport system permease subunit